MAGDWLDEAAPHLSPGSGLRQAINAAKEGKVNSLPGAAEVIKGRCGCHQNTRLLSNTFRTAQLGGLIRPRASLDLSLEAAMVLWKMKQVSCKLRLAYNLGGLFQEVSLTFCFSPFIPLLPPSPHQS